MANLPMNRQRQFELMTCGKAFTAGPILLLQLIAILLLLRTEHDGARGLEKSLSLANSNLALII